MKTVELKLKDDLKEQLERFRSEEIERTEKQMNKTKDEELLRSLQAMRGTLKNMEYDVLLSTYISYHKSMDEDVTKHRRLVQGEHRRLINFLIEQRTQIDDMLERVGGKRFRDDLFDAESVNDMIRAAFRDIEYAVLTRPEESVLKMIRHHMERDWLK